MLDAPSDTLVLVLKYAFLGVILVCAYFLYLKFKRKFEGQDNQEEEGGV